MTNRSWAKSRSYRQQLIYLICPFHSANFGYLRMSRYSVLLISLVAFAIIDASLFSPSLDFPDIAPEIDIPDDYAKPAFNDTASSNSTRNGTASTFGPTSNSTVV
uniref:Uncharacterized protein n=1 Tax=Spongospora subterranea TaxID=70186 RepID=A0A0H5QG97_9EUKA|eukprot:CRZ00965.1 hypothetical protein [Spongospora subterranea]